MTIGPLQPPSAASLEIAIRDWKVSPVTQSLVEYLQYSINIIIPSNLIRDRNDPQKTQDNISRLVVYRTLIKTIKSADFVSQTTTADPDNQ